MFRADRVLTAEAAEGIAVQGLAFLAADPARLSRFLAATGLRPDCIRQQAAEPGFLAAVLEYIANDESLLLVFATTASIAPETVAPAVAILQQARSRDPRP